MPKIRVGGVGFHYWQSGHGPDVVLVHGLGGNLAAWHLDLVPDLQADHRVTTYDLRGHGRSDAPAAGYATRDMAQDLHGLMEALGIERAHLIGHSWGVDIALQLSLLHPHRVLDLALIEGALLSPLADYYRSPDWDGWPYVAETIATLSGTAVPDRHRHDLEYFLQQLVKIPIQYGPAQGRPRDGEIVSRVSEILRPMWEGHLSDDLTVEALSRIAHRALVLHESNSVFLRANELLRERLPRARAVALPGGRFKHFTGFEHPDLILRHVRSFLESGRLAASPASEGP